MRVILPFLLGLFLGITPASAQSDAPLYRVEDVAVSVKAASAPEAKTEAMVKAQRQAFEILVFRLGAQADAANMDPQALDALVQSFEVQKEKMGPGRYAGTFTFQFSPTAIRDFLNGNGMDYGEAPARPVVVLPIWISGSRTVLWEENTLWREAWDVVAKMSGRVPLIVPVGDLEDVSMIGAAEALGGDMQKIQEIMTKYKAMGVAVAVLKSDMDPMGYWQAGNIEIRRYGENGQAYAPLVQTFTATGTPGQDKIDPHEFLKEKAVKTAGETLLTWKSDDMADVTEQQPPAPDRSVFVMPIAVPVQTPADWAQIKAKLADVPSIIRTKVSSMARGMVYAEITYQGSFSTLQEELEQQELEVAEINPGRWELRGKSRGFL